MPALDGLKVGQYYTVDFLRSSGLLNSRSLDTIFQFEEERDLGTPKIRDDKKTFKVSPADDSPLMRVTLRNPQHLNFSAEYTTSQTGTILISEQGLGTRIVLTFGSIRTESLTGDAYLHSDGLKAFNVYFSNTTSVASFNIEAYAAENQPVKLTSTQGNKRLYVALVYYVEKIKDI